MITHENGMLKRAANSDLIRPVFSVLNPELTCTLPPYQTACGATDMMAHVMERYFTNTKNVEITDRMSEAVLLTIINETPKALANPNDYEARANLMWAGMVAHNDLLGVGREQDWSSHQMEHELSGLYDVAHGAGLAVMFPAWMKYVMHHDILRFAQFAVRVWGCEMDFQHPENTARKGIERYEQFVSFIGMPIRFSQLGAKAEDIPTLVKTMGLGSRTLGSFVKLTEADVKDIYEELMQDFKTLLVNDKIIEYLKNIRKELQSKSKLDQFHCISDAKLVDSLLWAFYSILKSQNTSKQATLLD